MLFFEPEVIAQPFVFLLEHFCVVYALAVVVKLCAQLLVFLLQLRQLREVCAEPGYAVTYFVAEPFKRAGNCLKRHADIRPLPHSAEDCRNYRQQQRRDEGYYEKFVFEYFHHTPERSNAENDKRLPMTGDIRRSSTGLSCSVVDDAVHAALYHSADPESHAVERLFGNCHAHAGALGEQRGKPAEQRSAAGKHYAEVVKVGAQLRRRCLKRRAYGVENAFYLRLHGGAHLIGGERHHGG